MKTIIRFVIGLCFVGIVGGAFVLGHLLPWPSDLISEAMTNDQQQLAQQLEARRADVIVHLDEVGRRRIAQFASATLKLYRVVPDAGMLTELLHSDDVLQVYLDDMPDTRLID